MNWKKWLGYNLYKKLWSLIGGRPFTYWLRDVWHKAEIVWILILVALGVALGHNYDWIEALKIMGIFTIGYIAGHLFWGKDWQEGQKGMPKDRSLDSK